MNSCSRRKTVEHIRVGTRNRLAAGVTTRVLVTSAVVSVALPVVLALTAAPASASAYSSAISADSPLAYYRFDESSGTTAHDSSGNGHDGTYASDADLGEPSLLAGDSDTALGAGTSTNPIMRAAFSGIPGGASDSWTIEVWYKSSVSTSYSSLDGVGMSNFYLNVSNTTVGLYTDASPISKTVQDINDGNPHLLDGTYDATSSTLALYVDGQLYGTETATLSSSNPALSINPRSSTVYDEFAVYSTPLTSADISKHWTVGASTASACASSPVSAYGKAVDADSPLAYYPLGDRSSSLVAYDYSGHCRNGVYDAESASTTGIIPSDPNTNALNPSATDFGVERSGWTGMPGATSPWTIEVWYESTVSASYSSSEGPGLSNFYLNVSNTTVSLYTDASTLSTTVGAINNGAAHQLVGTYNGSTLTLYVDGQFAQSESATLSSSNVGLSINSRASTAYEDFALYGSALPLSHIQAHYTAAGRQLPPTDGAPPPSELQGGGINNTQSCSGAGKVHGNATASPVDTESGNFWHTFTDVSIPGRGCPLNLDRTYNSDSASTNGPFGYGWSFSYGMSLAVSGSTATITQENGSQVTFTESGSVWSPAAPRYIATLTHNLDGTWTFVRQAKETYTFNSSGQLTAIDDLNGNTTSLSYSGGNLSTVTDPASRTLSFTWSGGHITEVTDANVSPSRTVDYGYDGSGNLTDVTDVAGGDTTFTYDGSHRITVMKDPVCEATLGCPGVQNHYDGSGRVDWQKDQLNRETTFAYSGDPATDAGGTTTITDPAGHETLDTYSYGVRVAETRGYGTAAATTTYVVYDPDTLAPVVSIDGNGNESSATYDSSGNPLTTNDALGRTTTYTYNSFNEPLTVEDPLGVTTTYTYDADGNLETSSTPVCSSPPCTGSPPHQVTTYTYGDGSHPGDVTSVTDPDSKVWTYTYDTYGDRTSVTDPNGNKSTSTYNADGWKLTDVSPKGNVSGCSCASTYTTTYTYAAFGDLATVTDPLSDVTTYGYDADRNQTSVTDPDGNTTTNRYDLAGELCWTLPGGTSTNSCSSVPTNGRATTYNDDGTVASQADGKGDTILSYSYDAAGRVTSTTDALSHTTSYTYDGNGNVLTKLDPVSGATCSGTQVGCTTYTYDADNELTTVSYSDSSSENVTSITYDADGQRTGVVDGTGTSAWTFDSIHRLTSYENGAGATVTYGYGSDLKDQVATIAYPNSVGTVTQTWNDNGTLASVEDWNSKTTTFGYDPDGNQTGMVAPSTTNVTDTFGYNAADQMTSVSDSNGTTLFSATYTRDDNGQLATDSSVPSSVGSYRYTALNQLCYGGSSNTNACSSPPSGADAYGYDNADNLTTNNGTTQQFNAADELCWTVTGSSANACGSAPSGATTFSYDNKGNRTAAVPASGSATCDTYDQANRLTAVKTGTGSTCTSATTDGSYTYDGTGLRQTKTVSGTTTAFTWTGTPTGQLLQQKAGSTITSFIYGPDGLPIEQITGSTPLWLHADQLGSTRLITDSAGATGTATTMTYDPYGNVTATTGSLTTPLQFAGQYADTETGLTYMRARYYDPVTAQFLSVDPLVGLTGDPYSYVGDNPANSVDQSGLYDAGTTLDAIGSALAEGGAVGTGAAVAGGVALGYGIYQVDPLNGFFENLGGSISDFFDSNRRDPTAAECNLAEKLLTQYERLAQKFRINLTPDELDRLNQKRDNETITQYDLPATLRREFPGYFGDMTLKQIRELCAEAAQRRRRR